MNFRRATIEDLDILVTTRIEAAKRKREQELNNKILSFMEQDNAASK